MTDEQEPVCATCGERTDDFDPLVGFDDFQAGACYHATCMTNALHEALGKAEAQRDEARALLRRAEDERDAAHELAAFLARTEGK